MFDFLRDLRKSADEKRHEQLNAYLDGELNERERQQFEQILSAEPALQEEVDRLGQIKAGLRRLPRLPVPRNFTLSSATSAPDPHPAGALYPALRVATVLTAFFFIFAIVIGNFPQPLTVSETIEVTTVVSETVADTDTASTDDLAAVADESLEPLNPTIEVVVEAEAEAADEITDEEALEESDEALADEADNVGEDGVATNIITATLTANFSAPNPTITPVPTTTPLPTATRQQVPATTTPPATWTPVPTPTDSPIGRVVSGVEETITSPSVPWLEIGLGLVLVTLLGATLYTRRFL